jgi:hypothetical protein
MHQTSKVHDIFTNLRHITTKTTSSINITPESASIAIYRNYGSKFVQSIRQTTKSIWKHLQECWTLENHGQKQNVTNVVCCNIDIHSTRIKRLNSNESRTYRGVQHYVIKFVNDFRFQIDLVVCLIYCYTSYLACERIREISTVMYR